MVDATRESIKYVLTQKGAGHSIVLVVGGAAEIAVLIVMCYNLVTVRDLLSWLWKLGECDVSPLRVSEALNI